MSAWFLRDSRSRSLKADTLPFTSTVQATLSNGAWDTEAENRLGS